MTPLIKHNVAVGDSSPVIDLDPNWKNSIFAQLRPLY
jgi:hypothetical protein